MDRVVKRALATSVGGKRHGKRHASLHVRRTCVRQLANWAHHCQRTVALRYSTRHAGYHWRLAQRREREAVCSDRGLSDHHDAVGWFLDGGSKCALAVGGEWFWRRQRIGHSHRRTKQYTVGEKRNRHHRRRRRHGKPGSKRPARR